jgi:hypothetical protein
MTILSGEINVTANYKEECREEAIKNHSRFSGTSARKSVTQEKTL